MKHTHFKGHPGVTTGHFGLLHAHILYLLYDYFPCVLFFVSRVFHVPVLAPIIASRATLAVVCVLLSKQFVFNEKKRNNRYCRFIVIVCIRNVVVQIEADCFGKRVAPNHEH